MRPWCVALAPIVVACGGGRIQIPESSATVVVADVDTDVDADTNADVDTTTGDTATDSGGGGPVATDDTYRADRDALLVVDATSGVLINDVDAEGDPLTAVLVAPPGSGSLALAPDGSFDYLPDPGFLGQDAFTYQASDGTGVSGAASVQIDVTLPNDPPIVRDDAYGTPVGAALAVSPVNGVLSNDADPDGDVLTVALDTTVTNGVLNLVADGSFTYAPDPGFAGIDTFTYLADDGRNPPAGPASVNISVGAANQPPVAADDLYVHGGWVFPLNESAPGVLANDTDPDGDPLTAVLISLPSNGSLTLNANGSFQYNADPFFSGIDAFTYQASDGTALSPVATVEIDVQ